MRLKELLKGVDVQSGLLECDITAITCDSRQTEPGSLFVCIPGQRFDGHDHAKGALEQGAAAILCQRDLGLERQVLVPDTRIALGHCCANFFGNPADGLTLLAVTGTNGKTTITYLLKHILEEAGYRVGLIGTIHNEIDDLTLPARYTTPDPIQLHSMFARMADAGCTHVVMEVSSHALDQERVAGIRFAASAFTNLSQDHLDYHGDMESYFQAKKKLFDQSDFAAINYDDDHGKRLLEEIDCNRVSYSIRSNDADYTAHDINFSAKGSRFALMAENRLLRVKLPTPGYFSVANALAAIATCKAAGVPPEQAAAALANCPGVPGRVEILPTDTSYTIIRDYAHAPDGLEKILETVREFAPGRVVCLFGCAGNRDRTKRPVMGEVVARLADFCILTSDNPRDEDPMRIINDALPGLKQHNTPYKVIVDRFDAIQWALDHAREDDVLVLAGKGHEDYQVLDFGTVHFDEKEIVLELLARKKAVEE